MSLPSPPHSPGGNAWSPLRQPTYRWLWIATLISNIGTWMQEVAASWLMTSLTPSPLMVSLVRAAASLPMFVLALPAGVIADLADRRRLLLATQGWMLAAAALLGTITLAGVASPWNLLAITFLLGLGGAINAPAWQATVSELVPAPELPAAISLNSMAFNIARAVGPALAGLLIAATGVGPLFLLNAVSYLGVVLVLYRWRRAPPAGPFPAERLAGAMRAGLRYLRHAPEVQTVLIRSALFVFCASALWALLPLIARQAGRGPAGYGLLLAFFGAGAVGGAAVLPRLRRRLSLDGVVTAGACLYAAVLFGLATLGHFGLLCLVQAFGGAAWLATLATFNTSVQTSVPSWVRARALSGYLLVFFAGMAGGSAFWGWIASRFGLPAAFLLAGGGMAAAIAARFRYRLTGGEGMNLAPSIHWPAPKVVIEPHPEHGPVMVQLEYRIDPAEAAPFAEAMADLGRIRRRDGAISWCLFADVAEPGRYLESYLVESWAEHLRQHERMTMEDRQIEAHAHSFHRGPASPTVSHFLAEPLPKRNRRRRPEPQTP